MKIIHVAKLLLNLAVVSGFATMVGCATNSENTASPSADHQSISTVSSETQPSIGTAPSPAETIQQTTEANTAVQNANLNSLNQ